MASISSGFFRLATDGMVAAKVLVLVVYLEGSL
jgi:hypothetical protein